MLKIHKLHSKVKLLVISITSIGGIGAFLGLTYHPSLAHAETVTYEPPKETRDMSQITYMQEMTPEVCQTAILNQQYTLTDSRDGKTYTVARIKNSTNNETNCWMTQNLSIIDKTISSEDSDIKLGSFIVPASDISGFVSNNRIAETAYYDNTYGGYYNWYTATAGSGNLSITKIGANAPDSICPRGWKLSTLYNKTGQFYNLLDGLVSGTSLAMPYNYKNGGYIHDGSLFHVGTSGHYWSSTVYNRFYAYRAAFTTDGGINLTAFSARYDGLSIRCIARTAVDNDNVEIKVNPTISLDVASEVVVEKGESNPSTKDFEVKVTSNQPYVVQISADDLEMKSSTTNVKIPAKSGLLNTNENGWGIKLSGETSYTAVTKDLQTFYTASGAEIKTIPFVVGISTATDLSSGEYSTEITVTATQN